jgi:hypothetical protein
MGWTIRVRTIIELSLDGWDSIPYKDRNFIFPTTFKMPLRLGNQFQMLPRSRCQVVTYALNYDIVPYRSFPMGTRSSFPGGKAVGA